jgi:hypothetical protein
MALLWRVKNRSTALRDVNHLQPARAISRYNFDPSGREIPSLPQRNRVLGANFPLRREDGIVLAISERPTPSPAAISLITVGLSAGTDLAKRIKLPWASRPVKVQEGRRSTSGGSALNQ